MIIRKCDRCGQKIDKNYWVINIYQHSDSVGMFSTKGVTNNIQENLKQLANQNEEYCEKCINEIKEFIQKGNNENEKVID